MIRTELAIALDRIVNLLRRYLVLPEYGYETIALYVAQTYMVHSVGTFAPLLILRSPEMRSGKTTTMDLVGELVQNPLAAANASAAALYRFMNDQKATLLLDEVDAYLAQKTEQSEAVRGIINAGHRKGRYSVVLRSNERGELQTFDVFGPKVLSGIGRVAATLQDRAITLTLRRKLPSEQVQRLRVARIEDEVSEIRKQISDAATTQAGWIEDYDPDIPSSLSDRQADNWELMLAIADQACGRWPELAREAAVTLSKQMESDDSPKMQLLADIAEYLQEHDGSIIPSAELVGYLSHCEHAPWPSWNKGHPITAQGVAVLLREFQTEAGDPIRPAQIKMGSVKVRGYRREWFEDALRRYLGIGDDAVPPSPGNTPEQGGTSVPTDPNSIQDNDLADTARGTRYRPARYQEGEGYHPTRYPVPERYDVNYLQDNDLRDIGTEVPPDSGVTAEYEVLDDGPALDPDFMEDIF
jgi:putative DNA primase/helicase